MPSFQHDYGLLPDQWTGTKYDLVQLKANITSFNVLGAAFGAILALLVTDRIGRLRTWQAFMALWMSGFFITTFASGILGLLLFSRLLSGLGAGGLTVVAPVYLTEIARSKSRGMVVSVYMVFLLSFLMFGRSLTPSPNLSICLTLVYYRILHQLWREKLFTPVQGAVSRCAMCAPDRRWHCLVLVALSPRHASMACLQRPQR